jgi:hypothetical protein
MFMKMHHPANTEPQQGPTAFSQVDDNELDLLAPAWASFVIWASKQELILLQFTKSTGLGFAQRKAVIDQLIDKAVGFDDKEAGDEIAMRFAIWVTVEFWGLEYAPKAFQEKVREQKEKENRPT